MQVSSRFDFTAWAQEQLITLPKVLDSLQSSGVNLDPSLDEISLQNDRRLLAFGYTFEQVSLLLGPMVSHRFSLT